MKTKNARVSAPGTLRWFEKCFISSFYDRMMAPLESAFLGECRQAIMYAVQGEILEIGGGTGANIPFLDPNLDLYLTEPNWRMCEKIRRREGPGRIRISISAAEALPFPPESFDAVISTLVLCTVSSQTETLCEVSRILRPGGKLIFVEHVKGKGFRAVLQDLLQPFWSKLGCGCRPNRRTVEAIAESGFAIRELEYFNPSRKLSQPGRSLIQLTLPFVRGSAVKN
jgi:ubiquinone/menaquinone biosynthesis C-methylase UbiE